MRRITESRHPPGTPSWTQRLGHGVTGLLAWSASVTAASRAASDVAALAPAGLTSPRLAATCRFAGAAEQTTDFEHSVLTTWEQADDPAWWEPGARPSPALATFRDWVSRQVDPDPIALMKHQQFIFHAASLPSENLDHVLDGSVGTLAGTRCLDDLLLAEHLRLQGPTCTEFECLVLRDSAGKRLRLHFESFAEAGRTASHASDAALADVEQGWQLALHLHNHPFDFDNPWGDVAGTPVPSSRDVVTYRLLAARGLPEAAICNGFNTTRFDGRDFAALVVKDATPFASRSGAAT